MTGFRVFGFSVKLNNRPKSLVSLQQVTIYLSLVVDDRKTKEDEVLKAIAKNV